MSSRSRMMSSWTQNHFSFNTKLHFPPSKSVWRHLGVEWCHPTFRTTSSSTQNNMIASQCRITSSHI